MSRKRKELPELKDVEIIGIAAEGKAFTKIKLKKNDESPIVVFVPYAAPGDVVDLKIDKKKHNYAEAHITRIVRPSSMRVEPKCKYFGICGGCKWQHIPYEQQLKFKRQQVVDALERIGKVEIPEVPMTLGSERIWGYRNKMEYTFSNKRWKTWGEVRGEIPPQGGDDSLGFHIPGSFDKVLQIDKCWLQDDGGNEIRDYMSRLVNHPELIEGLPSYSGNICYNIKTNQGLFRNLIIREATSGERMVCMVFGDEGEEGHYKNDTILSKETMDYLTKKFPDIEATYSINKKLNDTIGDQEVLVFQGKGYIEEKMGDLKFKISPKSFYQTNSRQAEILYKITAEFAGLTTETQCGGKPLVYDLYTGAGTIANYIAKYSSKVIGIEYVKDAIEDARKNSEINGISNTEFYAGDMKDVLTDRFIEEHGRPDIIIVDPPRAGMHEDVINVIMKAAPEVIVYVSCNPATQARDIGLLDKNYKVSGVQPVDMFPHTHHVENVVRLEKRQGKGE